MSDRLAARLERVELALQDVAASQRQLTRLLLQAIQGRVEGEGRAPARQGAQNASRAAQGASEGKDGPPARPGVGTAILEAVAGVNKPSTPPPWGGPRHGVGERLQGYLDRRAADEVGQKAEPPEGPGLRLRFTHDNR